MLWTSFFWMMTRMSQISNSFGRLGNSQRTKYIMILKFLLLKITMILFFFSALSDTDSVLLSFQSRRNELQKLEIDILLQQDLQIPYEDSFVANKLAKSFIFMIGYLLDWSSILNPDSFIFKTIFKDNPSLEVMLEYLAKVCKVLTMNYFLAN